MTCLSHFSHFSHYHAFYLERLESPSFRGILFVLSWLINTVMRSKSVSSVRQNVIIQRELLLAVEVNAMSILVILSRRLRKERKNRDSLFI